MPTRPHWKRRQSTILAQLARYENNGGRPHHTGNWRQSTTVPNSIRVQYHIYACDYKTLQSLCVRLSTYMCVMNSQEIRILLEGVDFDVPMELPTPFETDVDVHELLEGVDFEEQPESPLYTSWSGEEPSQESTVTTHDDSTLREHEAQDPRVYSLCSPLPEIDVHSGDFVPDSVAGSQNHTPSAVQASIPEDTNFLPALLEMYTYSDDLSWDN